MREFWKYFVRIGVIIGIILPKSAIKPLVFK
jgi:hypothetical protein